LYAFKECIQDVQETQDDSHALQLVTVFVFISCDARAHTPMTKHVRT